MVNMKNTKCKRCGRKRPKRNRRYCSIKCCLLSRAKKWGRTKRLQRLKSRKETIDWKPQGYVTPQEIDDCYINAMYRERYIKKFVNSVFDGYSRGRRF